MSPAGRVLPAVFVAFILVGLCPAVASAAVTVDCDAGDDLQVALDEASDGATIIVHGECIGSFATDSSLTLAGAPGAVLDGGDESGTVLTMSGLNSTVRTLMIRNGKGQPGLPGDWSGSTSGRGEAGGVGGLAIVATRATLEDVVFSANEGGPGGQGAPSPGAGLKAGNGGDGGPGAFSVIAPKVAMTDVTVTANVGGAGGEGGTTWTGVAWGADGGQGGVGGLNVRTDRGTISGLIVENNVGGVGGTGADQAVDTSWGGFGGGGGDGGANLTAQVRLDILDSTFRANTGGVGGPGGDMAPGGSWAGFGGRGGTGGLRMYKAVMTDVVIDVNVGGQGGFSGTSLSGGAGGFAGPGGTGGAYIQGGRLVRATVTSNRGGRAGTFGGWSNGGPGGIEGYGVVTLSEIAGNVGGDRQGTSGDGGTGGIEGWNLRLDRLLVRDNVGGRGYPPGTGGVSGSDITMSNVTVSGNVGGPGESFGGGGTGGVTIYEGGKVIYATIVGNAPGAPASDVWWNVGGFATNDIEDVHVSRSILSNTGSDCGLSIQSAGYNLIQEIGTPCDAHLKPTDIVGPAPLLLSLADNGGETQTMALGPGSPALDAIPAPSCASKIDQRTEPRPVGSGCDIGAFEQQG